MANKDSLQIDNGDVVVDEVKTMYIFESELPKLEAIVRDSFKNVNVDFKIVNEKWDYQAFVIVTGSVGGDDFSIKKSSGSFEVFSDGIDVSNYEGQTVDAVFMAEIMVYAIMQDLVRVVFVNEGKGIYNGKKS